MKLAIVFDDLVQFGGAERLLLAVLEIWPDAPLYTCFASKKWQKLCKEKNIKLQQSFMRFLPFTEILNRYYATLLMHPLAYQSFNLNNYDVVLSISSRFAHGVITKPTTKHVCYMNSPGRMFWEPSTYFAQEDFQQWPLNLKVLKKLASGYLNFSLSNLRLWDYTSAQRVDVIVANSKVPQKRIQKYYNRKSGIIYPFIDHDKLSIAFNASGKNGGYFFIASRHIAWKRLDIAIQACNKLSLKLKIAGEGPDTKRLKSLAGPTIEFLGYISEDKKIQLLANCLALIHPQHEDFGLVPLEAQAVGRPVIAFGQGGALETIIPGVTGEFFYEQTPEALVSVLKAFNQKKYSPVDCKANTLAFDKKNFVRQLKSVVENVACA